MQVNFCAKLSTDACHTVRLEFLDAAGAWILDLEERLDHQGRLLPYLLTAVCDDHDLVRQRAVELIDKIGALYEQDNAIDLKDTLQYLPQEAHNIGWCEDKCTRDPWEVMRSGHDVGLPSALNSKPRIGARRMVAVNFGHAVHGIVLELGGWKNEHRYWAAQLLAVYIAFVEESVLQHLHDLLPALCRALAASSLPGKDAELCRKWALNCCMCIGLFVQSTQVFQILIPRILDTSSELALQLAAVQAATAFLQGRAHVKAKEALDDIVAAICGVASAQAPNLRHALLHAVKAVTSCCYEAESRLPLTKLSDVLSHMDKWDNISAEDMQDISLLARQLS
jgi:hypothetical protein